MAISDVVNAIAVTAELTGAVMSAAAMAVMAKDLVADHGEEEILRALARCRRELKRPLTSGAVFDFLAVSDGRPSSDEAWAMALLSVDERETVVWNHEIQQAMAAARPVLGVGDKVGARMAFREAYDRIVRVNREAGIRPEWSASLGWDEDRRASALLSAQERGLLSSGHVAALLPAPPGGFVESMLFGGKAIAAPVGLDDAERAAKWCSKIINDLARSRQELSDRQEAAAKMERDRLAEAKRKAADAVSAGMSKKGKAA